MQSLRNSVLRYVRIRVSTREMFLASDASVVNRVCRPLCTSAGTSPNQIMARVLGLVKKFDKIDATKVTEKADFQKDLCLDSLDRVELVMAFEQEFSIEIPEEKADKLKCCADVAKYIVSGDEQKITGNS
ncbi:hypothetical protein LguiA_015215 [Lonicera macranthoides]